MVNSRDESCFGCASVPFGVVEPDMVTDDIYSAAGCKLVKMHAMMGSETKRFEGWSTGRNSWPEMTSVIDTRDYPFSLRTFPS